MALLMVYAVYVSWNLSQPGHLPKHASIQDVLRVFSAFWMYFCLFGVGLLRGARS